MEDNEKARLHRWWQIFNKPKGKAEVAPSFGRVFGVSLQTSLSYASVAISQVSGIDGKARIYGHVPVVVAKTGLFLKENGLETAGVFRVSGSSKRIKELEQIFDSGPTYGKDLTWENYSVHDGATVFRRYLNMLPEPVIPYQLYPAFQTALPRNPDSSALTQMQKDAAVSDLRKLINSLPPAAQHIFFYVLDLLGVFARKSEVNLMPSSNLATIFQPGLLRHPPSAHHLPPPASASAEPVSKEQATDAVKAVIEADSKEHKRSQEVLEFLINNQSQFELELPPHLRKKLGNSPKRRPAPLTASQQTSTSTSRAPASKKVTAVSNQSSDEENNYILSQTTRLATGLARRGSDKSEDRRRLRRKKAAEQKVVQEPNAVGVKRSKTLPKDARPSRKGAVPATIDEGSTPSSPRSPSSPLVTSPVSPPVATTKNRVATKT